MKRQTRKYLEGMWKQGEMHRLEANLDLPAVTMDSWIHLHEPGAPPL